MFEHPEVPDAHNASVFLWCYKRMGEFIPQLVDEGKSPRVMLDYSGLPAARSAADGGAGRDRRLKPLARDPAYRRCVEWLGTAWGHAVAPSTPARDFRLHVRAWQHHFAAMFGLEALGRVRGFSPPEMALPNHPDACYEFVRTLQDVRLPLGAGPGALGRAAEDGGAASHARTCRTGWCAAIRAGNRQHHRDHQDAGQRYEARRRRCSPITRPRGLRAVRIGRQSFPQLVTQIGDGENGGVMMNEFPPKFLQVMREASGSQTPAMNVTEYLEHLAAAGVHEEDFPPGRPLFHKRIWERLQDGSGPRETGDRDRPNFGGGRTVFTSKAAVGPASDPGSRLRKRHAARWRPPARPSRKRATIQQPMCPIRIIERALFHLLLCQTSCFRYWGQGAWTDYGRELCSAQTQCARQMRSRMKLRSGLKVSRRGAVFAFADHVKSEDNSE